MLDDWALATITVGTSHIVALRLANGAPIAMRGWGAIVGEDRITMRVLLDAADVQLVGDDPAGLVGSWIAYTSAAVRTLSSIQLKGRITSAGPSTAVDQEVRVGYCNSYYEAVQEVDFISREMMERMEPDELVAVEFVVQEVYDQSPGPLAGRAYRSTS